MPFKGQLAAGRCETCLTNPANTGLGLPSRGENYKASQPRQTAGGDRDARGLAPTCQAPVQFCLLSVRSSAEKLILVVTVVLHIVEAWFSGIVTSFSPSLYHVRG